jgi:hypothetical protein
VLMLSPWTVSVKKGLRNDSYKNSSSVLWFSGNIKTLDEVVTRDIPPTDATRPSRFRPIVESTSGPGGNRTC